MLGYPVLSAPWTYLGTISARGFAIYDRFFHDIDQVERAVDGVARAEDQAGDRHHLATAVAHEKAEDQRQADV